jgi:hypothetical protein
MLTITIDTREQAPWPFGYWAGDQWIPLAETQRGTIPAGDYALAGDEYGFALERKSLPDYVSTVTRDWDRFRRELDRMAEMPARVVIVEASVDDIMQHTYPGRVTPQFVLRQTARLLLAGVGVWFAGTRDDAQGLALLLLRLRSEYLQAVDLAADGKGVDGGNDDGDDSESALPAGREDDAGKPVVRARHGRGDGSWGDVFCGRTGPHADGRR